MIFWLGLAAVNLWNMIRMASAVGSFLADDEMGLALGSCAVGLAALAMVVWCVMKSGVLQ